MALQTTGAISIDNIRTELGQAQANSSLRSLSSLAGKSTPDAMSEFYGFSNATAYTFSESGFPDAETACGEGPSFGTQTLYSAATTLVVDSILYTGSSLSETFDGQDQWWYATTGKSYYINTAGRIVDIFQC